MKWTIAFDSGCDLREFPCLPDVSFSLVPLKIVLGQEAVSDDGSTDLEVLQQQLDSLKCKTGTACPSIGEWKQAMEAGENVICVTISGAVSGSYQSACAARDMLQEKYPQRNYFVLDSVSGSGNMLSLVNCALEEISKGSDFSRVTEAMEACRQRLQIFFLLQNVDNLMMSGRLKPLIGRAVKALRLCLLATVNEEGSLGVIAKVGNFQKAMDKSIEECKKRNCSPKKALISHCLNEDGAKVMAKKLQNAFPGIQVDIMKTGLLCGYYAEKGGLIVALEA